jgi:hypothetical protein
MTTLHSYIMLLVPRLDYLASITLFLERMDDFFEEMLPGINYLATP